MHKNGAGGHNWGSYVEEAKQQQHGIDRSEEVRDDDDDEEQEDGQEDDGAGPAITKDDTTTGAASQVSDDGNNGVSSSARKPGPPRRASSGMTAEERERARQWRHGVMQREGESWLEVRTTAEMRGNSRPRILWVSRLACLLGRHGIAWR